MIEVFQIVVMIIVKEKAKVDTMKEEGDMEVMRVGGDLEISMIEGETLIIVEGRIVTMIVTIENDIAEMAGDLEVETMIVMIEEGMTGCLLHQVVHRLSHPRRRTTHDPFQSEGEATIITRDQIEHFLLARKVAMEIPLMHPPR